MYLIGKRFSFEAAHALADLPAGHKCARLHGHTYTVEIELTASQLVPPGFVTDFADLTPFRRYLTDTIDHRHLNEVLPVEPTSENLARHFFTWCVTHLEPGIPARISAVRVSETPQSWAEYRQEQE
ncbi:MAG: 6-carboxytetrahydropterin synthase QueD [Streptosporangiaceae bacterium]